MAMTDDVDLPKLNQLLAHPMALQQGSQQQAKLVAASAALVEKYESMTASAPPKSDKGSGSELAEFERVELRPLLQALKTVCQGGSPFELEISLARIVKILLRKANNRSALGIV